VCALAIEFTYDVGEGELQAMMDELQMWWARVSYGCDVGEGELHV
jgi:hypothetical protein